MSLYSKQTGISFQKECTGGGLNLSDLLMEEPKSVVESNQNVKRFIKSGRTFQENNERSLLMNKVSIFLALVLSCFLLSGLPAQVQGEEHVYEHLELEEGKWFYHSEPSEVNDVLSYRVELETGESVDVYVMDWKNYENYQDDRYFNPKITHNNTPLAVGEYEFPSNQRYYLVVDNSDNGRADDTEPEGNVTVTITVEFAEKKTEGVSFYLIVAILLVLVGGILGIFAMNLGKREMKLQENSEKNLVFQVEGSTLKQPGPGKKKWTGYGSFVVKCPNCRWEFQENNTARPLTLSCSSCKAIIRLPGKQKRPGETEPEPAPKEERSVAMPPPPAAPPKPQKVEAPTPEEKPASPEGTCPKCGGTLIFGKCFNCDYKEGGS